MAKIPVNKEYFTFVQGLITEAGPLTFPENASKDEDNFVLNRKGYRSRRFGLDLEVGFDKAILDTRFTTVVQDGGLNNYLAPSGGGGALTISATSTFLWKGVGNDALGAYSVNQVGNAFYFYDATLGAFSANPLPVENPQVDSSDDQIPLMLTGDRDRPASYATVSGKLVITTSERFIWLIEDKTDGFSRFTITKVGLNVRDLWGVEDPFDVAFDPPGATNPDYEDNDVELTTHRYNLVNQGWSHLDMNQYGTVSGHIGRLPANNEPWAVGVDTSDNNTFNGELFPSTSLLGRTHSPRGNIILDLFNRGQSRRFSFGRYTQNLGSPTNEIRLDMFTDNNFEIGTWGDLKIHGALTAFIINSAQEAIDGAVVQNSTIEDVNAGIPIDRHQGGIIDIAAYAGRAFYLTQGGSLDDGDIQSPLIDNVIWYSQTLDDITKLGKCYQEGSPSSFEEFDILATDGGFISIPEMGGPIKMVPLGKSLLVFAENGIWTVSGTDGFSATDNTVSKVSNLGVISKNSIIATNDAVFFWTSDGIHFISMDNVTLTPAISNVTETTIQSFYNDIPPGGKEVAFGLYDPSNKLISWIYNDDPTFPAVGEPQVSYNRQLNLDTVIGAFYTFTFGFPESNIPVIHGMALSPNFNISTVIDPVVVGEDTVQVGGEDVGIFSDRRTNGDSKAKYFVSTLADEVYNVTFADINNADFGDWKQELGVGIDAAAFLETGFELVGDTQRQKQSQYVTTHMERTETGFDSSFNLLNASSCLMTPSWDFADSAASGKIGTPQEVYRFRRNFLSNGVSDTFDYGQSVITTKNKIRGRGKALTLKFETQPNKDCILYGWANNLNVNAGV